jgi:FeS assembly SUF system protein
MINEEGLRDVIRDEVVRVLRTVRDPEIPVNVYDLGLVYAIDVNESGAVSLRMTLTAPGCPVAGLLVEQIQTKLLELPIVSTAEVEIVWDPPWTRDRMSPAARLALGL